MKRIRIIDVAECAGVSKSTVSQYLNGRFNHMSNATKEKIKQAIEKLDYVPDRIAQSLKSDKSKTIGVIVRDITGFNTSRILRGIDDYCKDNDYNVLIYNTDFNADTERQSLQVLKQMRVDGIIITSSGQNNDLINQYANNGFPIVQFQLEYPGCQTSIVLSNYFEAAKQATQYLLELGHQRICFLTQEFETYFSRKQRYQGYITAIEEAGLAIDTNLIQYWDREKAFHQLPISLLNQPNPPTAFFTQHLAITVDLLKHLKKENISIPQQVSILGFDEIPMVEMFEVPITIIQQDAYNIGFQSAKMLLSKMSGKEHPEKIIIPCSLIKRMSCQKINL